MKKIMLMMVMLAGVMVYADESRIRYEEIDKLQQQYEERVEKKLKESETNAQAKVVKKSTVTRPSLGIRIEPANPNQIYDRDNTNRIESICGIKFGDNIEAYTNNIINSINGLMVITSKSNKYYKLPRQFRNYKHCHLYTTELNRIYEIRLDNYDPSSLDAPYQEFITLINIFSKKYNLEKLKYDDSWDDNLWVEYNAKYFRISISNFGKKIFVTITNKEVKDRDKTEFERIQKEKIQREKEKALKEFKQDDLNGIDDL